MSVGLSNASVVVSIVSHGHGLMVQKLLHQLALQKPQRATRVVVTHNINESALVPPADGWPFAFQTIVNSQPQGFGANHNQALNDAIEEWVCILNPDVELIEGEEDLLGKMLSTPDAHEAGCIYPVQINQAGKVQESERELLTPWALLRRRAFHKTQRKRDWVNGAFLLIPSKRWHAIQGFDARYFMYCEDVDLCLRLQLSGWGLLRSNACVIHEGQRASGRQWRHLLWHLRSLGRLWLSSPFWRYLMQHS